LDQLRKEFGSRFINVGIAEQNLINIATGLAIEGFTVYAYAIAPFLTMRAYEQIRINLAMYAQLKEINVNLVGVGAGLSYDVSGPTHHCFEDLSIMRTLPNLVVFSPSDWVLTRRFVDYSIKIKKPKYIRLDGKPLPAIYRNPENLRIENGFSRLRKGKKICLVSTGYMTHKAIKIAEKLAGDGIDAGIIDVFLLTSFDERSLLNAMKGYSHVITLEEGFINKGGLDSFISSILGKGDFGIKLHRVGFKDKYVFDLGSREYLHRLNNIDEDSVARLIKKIPQ
jgi:transketolase